MINNKILKPTLIATLLFASTTCLAKLKVATSFTIIQDIAANIAGDAADVVSITKPGAEIHEYQPTPKDLRRVQDADLILYNGLNLELWFEKFLKNIKGATPVVVTEGIEPLLITEGAYQGLPNPHAWMSTKNALIYIENIKNALVKHDPENAKTYELNARNYAIKIKNLDLPLRKKMLQVPVEKRFLATSEGAFSYLAHDYGYQEAYLWPINAEQQGTPQQVKNLIEIIKTNKVPVVFSESTVSDKSARQVAKEAGVKYGGVLYVDSLTNENGPTPTYLDLLNVTISTIVAGFEE